MVYDQPANIQEEQEPVFHTLPVEREQGEQVGALPPQAQEAREKEAIRQLLKEMSLYDPSVIIEKREDVLYHVETKEASLDIKVVYEKRDDGMLGPVKFHLEIQQ